MGSRPAAQLSAAMNLPHKLLLNGVSATPEQSGCVSSAKLLDSLGQRSTLQYEFNQKPNNYSPESE